MPAPALPPFHRAPVATTVTTNRQHGMFANWLRRVSKWGVLATLTALVLIVGVDGWLSRSLPDLRPWQGCSNV
jgi:hypothetical protein